MGVKLEIPDDCRVQERDGVGCDGIAEAGMKFFGHRRAADLRPAFQHRDFEPGGGEVSGGDEPVMAAADYDDVRHSSSRGAIGCRETPVFCWIASLSLAMTSASPERGMLLHVESDPLRERQLR